MPRAREMVIYADLSGYIQKYICAYIYIYITTINEKDKKFKNEPRELYGKV